MTGAATKVDERQRVREWFAALEPSEQARLAMAFAEGLFCSGPSCFCGCLRDHHTKGSGCSRCLCEQYMERRRGA